VILLLATAQFSYASSNSLLKGIDEHNKINMLIESLPDTYAGEYENAAVMDFDVNKYLPNGFDAYKGMIIDESHALIKNAIPFMFDTNSYLPANFDVYKGMIIDESYALIEESISFTFDVNSYLPANFDVYEGLIIEEEVIEEEIPFDFNTEEYLPIGFNPNAPCATKVNM